MAFNKALRVFLFIIFLFALPSAFATDAEVSPPMVTVMQMMESVITPMTNIIWGADDPKTDEDWRQLENASINVIAMGNLMRYGGAGERDQEWASNPAWQAFTTVMTNAAIDALSAAQNRDIEALFGAGDILYPPCEGCHLQFNPGVVGQ